MDRLSKIKRPPPLLTEIEDVRYRTLQTDIDHYEIIENEKNELLKLKEELSNPIEKIKGIISTTYIDKEHQVTQKKRSHILKTKYEDTDIDIKDTHIDIITTVYGIKYEEDKWIKIYTTELRYKTIIESEFLFEVYYQKKAYTLNKSCNFISPNVIEYGQYEQKINKDEYIIHYIIMDYIPETKLNKDECKQIKQTVKTVDNCLKDNGIYHNDLAARNVFSRNGMPIIIDFGQALNKERGLKFELDCDNKVDHIFVLGTPPHSPLHVVTPSPPHSPNGGKRKKPNYSKKIKRVSKRGSKKKKTRLAKQKN